MENVIYSSDLGVPIQEMKTVKYMKIHYFSNSVFETLTRGGLCWTLGIRQTNKDKNMPHSNKVKQTTSSNRPIMLYDSKGCEKKIKQVRELEI